MRAQVTSIPVDEKTGELIPPRSPKHSPRGSAAPFSSPTRSLLGLNNNSPSRKCSSVNNNNDNNNGDELTEIPGIDSITNHSAGETMGDFHKDTETVKSKTCSVM